MLWRTLQVTGFQLHLKYEEIPLPRRGDVVIVEFAMEGGLSKEDLLSMSRVKGKLGAIFLSDLVTADGKHMETFVCQREANERPSSKYRFPRENQLTTTGKCGLVSGVNTLWETSNSTHHWVGGLLPLTDNGSGSMTKKIVASKRKQA